MAAPPTDIDRLLDREALKGEQWRAAVLAALLIVPLSVLAVQWTFHFHAIETYLGDVYARTIVLAAFALAIAMEVRIYFRAIERLQAGTSPPLLGRIAQSGIEALLPTVVVWAQLHAGNDPRVMLGFPPTYLYLVVVVLSISRLEPIVSLVAGAVGTLGFLVLVICYAPPGELLLQLGRPASVAAATLIATWITRSLREYVHRLHHATSTFGQYVSPSIAQKLLDQRGELPSELRHVCVMFLDIRDFTRFSERRSPEEVVTFLNDVFTFMIDVVNDHHGVINKFLGDGFMAVFGAPTSDGRDCENALAAARALLAELGARVADGRLPPTRIGIGLHAGPAVTGNVGSATRREYTVIGDVVNLASRIESMNKELGSTLLLSGEVVAALPVKPEPLTARGPVKVKGREAPVELFQAA